MRMFYFMPDILGGSNFSSPKRTGYVIISRCEQLKILSAMGMGIVFPMRPVSAIQYKNGGYSIILQFITRNFQQSVPGLH